MTWTMDIDCPNLIQINYLCRMKALIIVWILILLSICSCNRQATIDPLFPWPSSGVREADSLLVVFEKERNLISDTDSDIQDQFSVIARHYPNNHLLQFRDAYLKTCAIPTERVDAFNRSVDSCFLFIDSVEDTYDWHMASALKSQTNEDVVTKYNRILDNIAYFRKVKSATEESRSLIQGANLLIELGDTVSSRDFSERALQNYMVTGLTNNAYFVKLNLARTISPNKQDSVYRSILNDPQARKIDRLMINTYQNSFIFNEDSIQFIDSAIVKQSRRKELGNIPLFLALKGEYYMRHGDRDKAIRYIREGFDSVHDGFYTRYIQSMLTIMGVVYRKAEIYDTAAMAFKDALIWRDSLDRELDKVRIVRLDGLNRIKMARQEESIRRYHVIIWSGLAIALLIVVILLLVLRTRKREAEKEIKELKLAQDVEQARQSVRAQAMVIKENERFVEDISSNLLSMRESSEIDSTSADKIIRMLKLHKAGDENRLAFLQLHQDLDIKFRERMLADFPSLSEGQLKLASLIACGLDTPAICKMLNIEPASVHKARYRLRQRLKIANDQNLENFLQSYNSY